MTGFKVLIPALGPRGQPGAQIIQGEAAPEAEQGNDGDFWIRYGPEGDTQIYGPKTDGAWGAGRSIRGGQGTPGLRGWNPVILPEKVGVEVSEGIFEPRVLLKLVAWIGGQGTVPTTYVGQYARADGEGFTEDETEAMDILGPPFDAEDADFDGSTSDFDFVNIKLGPALRELGDDVAALGDVLAALGASTQTRQTVQTGPVNGNGRAEFLAAGTGLKVVMSGLETTPLQLTFGDGFGNGRPRNVGVTIDANLERDSLPDDEDEVFIFVAVDPGEDISLFHETLAPHYGLTAPGSPATGQTFYPTDHRHRMRRWDGAAWTDDDLILCVGQVATSSGSVASAISYAYQGQAITGEAATSGLVTLAHNVGVGHLSLDVEAFEKFTSSSQGYSSGDIISISDNNGITTNAQVTPRATHLNASLAFGSSSGTLNVASKSGGGNGNTTAFNVFVKVRRAF